MSDGSCTLGNTARYQLNKDVVSWKTSTIWNELDYLLLENTTFSKTFFVLLMKGLYATSNMHLKWSMQLNRHLLTLEVYAYILQSYHFSLMCTMHVSKIFFMQIFSNITMLIKDFWIFQNRPLPLDPCMLHKYCYKWIYEWQEVNCRSVLLRRGQFTFSKPVSHFFHIFLNNFVQLNYHLLKNVPTTYLIMV